MGADSVSDWRHFPKVSADTSPNLWGHKNNTHLKARLCHHRSQAAGQGAVHVAIFNTLLFVLPKLSTQAPLLSAHIQNQARSDVAAGKRASFYQAQPRRGLGSRPLGYAEGTPQPPPFAQSYISLLLT